MNEMQFDVDRLNRLYALYLKGLRQNVSAEFYRIERLQKYLCNLISDVKIRYGISTITMNATLFINYFPDTKENLNSISQTKNNACKSGNYDKAAEIRDLEKEFMIQHLKSLDIRTRFFLYENKIFGYNQ